MEQKSSGSSKYEEKGGHLGQRATMAWGMGGNGALSKHLTRLTLTLIAIL
jgi:hypothetical protein